MRGRLLWIIVAVLVTGLLAGCGEKSDSGFDGEGYIYEINENRVLVLDQITPEMEEKTWNDLFADGSYTGRAIVLETTEKNLEIGQKVRYWIDGEIMESYPEQATARKIKVVKEDK